MKILGITGSIASGKNFITEFLQEKFSAEIFDADEVAHQLMINDQEIIDSLKHDFPLSYTKATSNSNEVCFGIAVLNKVGRDPCRVKNKKYTKKNSFFPPNINSSLPDQTSFGYIDRKILANEVAKNPQNIHKIEKIIHPKIHQKYQEFLDATKRKNCSLALLNIPLLLESDAYKCDAILVIIAKKEIRKLRFIARNLAKNDYFVKKEINDKTSKIRAWQSKNYEELFFTINSWLKLQNNSKIDKKFIGGTQDSVAAKDHQVEEKCDLVANLSNYFLLHEKQKDYQFLSDLIADLETKFEFFNQKQLSDIERIAEADFVMFNEENV